MRWTLVATALLGAAAVALGALGAHALAPLLNEKQMSWLETGLRYHIWHVLALLAVHALHQGKLLAPGFARMAILAHLGGILLFSGSLYILALADIRAMVWITPVGGVMLIGGWLLLALAGIRPSARRNAISD